MSIFYSLDRLRSLSPGMQITLENAGHPIPSIQNYTQHRFNTGLSRHGKWYALNPNFQILKTPAAQSEIIFELYRRAHHPDRPSRFLSMFGCETVREAAYFRGKTDCGINTNIFEVYSGPGFHRADMNLLNTECSLMEMELKAELYWTGKTEVVTAGYKPFWEILIPLPATIGEKINE